MPFHGYGLAYCNRASCPVLDCPDDHDTPLHDSSNQPLPRSVGHTSNKPVDLSKHCTGTDCGTWSVGGGKTTSKPQPCVQTQSSTSQQGAALSSDLPPPYEAIASKAENMYAVAQTQSVPSGAVGTSKDSKDTVTGQSETEREEIERIEYEKRQAALLKKVRASGFPLPIRPGEAQGKSSPEPRP